MDRETPACLCRHVQLGCQHRSKPMTDPKEQGSQSGGRAQASAQMGSCPAHTGQGTPVLGGRRAGAHSIRQLGSLGRVTVTTLGLCFHPVKRHDKLSLAWPQGSSPSPVVGKTALPYTQVGSVLFMSSRSRPPWSTHHSVCHGHRVPNAASIASYAPPRIIITVILKGVCHYSHFPQEKIKLRKDKSLAQSHAASRW